MQEHTVRLQEQEFTLIRTIRNIPESRETQNAVIEQLIREIEAMFAKEAKKKPIKWLQVGKRAGKIVCHSVNPTHGAPLTSDIIIEQRG